MTIILKNNSSGTAGPPAVGDLVSGEVGLDTLNGKLYCKNDSNVIVEIGKDLDPSAFIPGTIGQVLATIDDGFGVPITQWVNNPEIDDGEIA